MSSLVGEIAKNTNRVFRRLFIKRRLASTGLFEADWQEVSEDVKRWGSITSKLDAARQNRLRFSRANIVVANDKGRYNPADNEASLWFGYASQQRSLVKIEAGYVHQTMGADGIWTNTEYPTTNPIVFSGILQGDLPITEKDDITLKVSPLTQIFRDYPARALSGYTSTGMTASDFMEMVRDQTSGGNYIFRPFFGDTTTNWDLQTTTTNYADLDTQTAAEVRTANVWSVMEKLAEAENYLLFVTPDGILKFRDKADITTATSYEFHGIGSFNRTYGHNIISLQQFGFRQSKYYARVELKWQEQDTETSYVFKEADFTISADNSAWNLGFRTFKMDNLWIADTATANTVATNVFNEISSEKNEIKYTAAFIPHLTLLDRVSITYNSNPATVASVWDVNNWADTAGAAAVETDLIWDEFQASAINLSGNEYKPLQITLNLDKLQTILTAKGPGSPS